MAFDNTPNRLDAAFIQRDRSNQYYEQINISGSDLIVYLDETGSLTADRISVWAAKYGIGSGGSSLSSSWASASISASFSDTASYSLNAGLSPTSSYAHTASFLNPFTSITSSLSASFHPSTSLSQGSLILWINAFSSSYFDSPGTVKATEQGQIIRHFKDLSGLGRNIQTPTPHASAVAYKYGLVFNTGPNNNKAAIWNEYGSVVGAYSSTFSSPTYPLWLFCVAKCPPGNTTTQTIFDGVTSGTRMGCWIGTTPQLYSGAALTAAITGSLTGSILRGDWCLWSFKNTSGGTNSYIKLNGTQSVFGNCGAQSLTGYTFGSDYALNGGANFIIELLLFSNITDADALNIENWLKCRHELTY